MIHCPKCEGDIEFNRADNGTYRGNCGHCGHNFGAPFQDYPSAVESALDAIRKWRQLQVDRANPKRGWKILESFLAIDIPHPGINEGRDHDQR